MIINRNDFQERFRPMYGCNCNGISEREVRIAVQSGAKCWTVVHAHHGHEPCYGRCECEISDVINEGEASREPHAGSIFGAPALAVG
jgi:bacterioferritin-associated ferredoxin